MTARPLLCALGFCAISCGGIVVGDANDAASTPDVPDDAGTAAFARCDDKLSASWKVGCGGAPVDHGELCATPASLRVCGSLPNGCTGAGIDAILTACAPSFFSTPGAKFGVDVDDSGCVTSIEWALVDDASVQCAVDHLTGLRFPCFAATAITASCSPPTR